MRWGQMPTDRVDSCAGQDHSGHSPELYWGSYFTSHNSRPATNATIAPRPMLTGIALVWVNPSTHGDTVNQSPRRRLSHSSQSENATSAAIDTAAIAAPLAQTSMRATLPANAKS